jgi:hypothetical protein
LKREKQKKVKNICTFFAMCLRPLTGFLLIYSPSCGILLARRYIMAQLELTREEMTALLKVLQSDYSDLRMEIANTDRKEFRDHLKETKEVLNSVIAKLEKALPVETTE